MITRECDASMHAFLWLGLGRFHNQVQCQANLPNQQQQLFVALCSRVTVYTEPVHYRLSSSYIRCVATKTVGCVPEPHSLLQPILDQTVQSHSCVADCIGPTQQALRWGLSLVPPLPLGKHQILPGVCHSG